jgi:hypothetical protein
MLQTSSSPGRNTPRRFELAFELHELVQFAVQHLRAANGDNAAPVSIA